LRLAATLAGVVLLTYAATMLARGDPLTAGYNAWQQRKLEHALGRTGPALPFGHRGIARAARGFAADLDPGDPVGRIRIPALGLERVVVYGTGSSELAKGPGQYEETPLPGTGGTTAIAGHRTTFGAPFREIDALRPGAPIVLEVPYGTFRYVVFAREIVAEDDWTIVRRRPFETLVLTACHPLYGSSHRWVVYARRTAPS
jgi:sortase A